MQKENSTKIIRNAVVGTSAIALLLILLAVMNSIPEIKNTMIAEIISVSMVLKLIFLIFIVVALAYLIFPLSSALVIVILNLAGESNVIVDDKALKRIRTFSKRVVVFLMIPLIYLTLIFPLRDFAKLSERYAWMPVTYVYIILGVMVIVLLILLISVGPFVEVLRKKEE